jgi:hypothetical protein
MQNSKQAEDAKAARQLERTRIKQALVAFLHDAIQNAAPKRARSTGETSLRLVVAVFYVARPLGSSDGYQFAEDDKTIPALRGEKYSEACKLVKEVVSEWREASEDGVTIDSSAEGARDGGYAGVGASRYAVAFKIDWSGRKMTNCCIVQ